MSPNILRSLTAESSPQEELDAVVEIRYERIVNEPVIIDVAGVEVQLYQNDDDQTIYASWLDDTVTFTGGMVSGVAFDTGA